MAVSTRTALGFLVQKKDLDPSASAAEATEQSGPKTFTFRANDGEYDRYNDRLSVKGWKLDDFNGNPIILYNHDAGTGGWFTPPTKSLPIGKGVAYVKGDALMVDIQFDPNDPFAKQIESKVEFGALNAVSVRYRMAEGKYRENERHGYDCDEQELLEISVVTIPGNQRALRVKSFEEERADFVAALADAVVKALDARDAARSSTPPPPLSPESHGTPVPAPAQSTPTPAPKAAPADFSPIVRAVAEHVLKFAKESK